MFICVTYSNSYCMRSFTYFTLAGIIVWVIVLGVGALNLGFKYDENSLNAFVYDIVKGKESLIIILTSLSCALLLE